MHWDTSLKKSKKPVNKMDKEELKNSVIEVIKGCYDPEIPVNIWELGLVYSINIDDESNVEIEMTLTSPMCPVAGSMPPEIENKVMSIPGVKSCKVKVVWDPPWGLHMMSEEAKLHFHSDFTVKL
jgi:FeS assembly SUF system protein